MTSLVNRAPQQGEERFPHADGLRCGQEHGYREPRGIAQARRAAGGVDGSVRQRLGRSHHSGRLKRRQQFLARVDPIVIAAIAADRSGGVERQVVLSGEAEFCNRGWSLGIPDCGIGLCNEGPDLLQAVLD